MKIIYSFFLTFALSCSSSTARKEKSKYMQMHELWQMKASPEDVKKAFGSSFVMVDSGITYSFPNTKFPEIGFFFDSFNKLEEQFAFLDEASLTDFKKAINCEWKETEAEVDIAHYRRVIKKGACLTAPIRYETYLDLHGYEVRWKR